jgi:hypothetical protein
MISPKIFGIGIVAAFVAGTFLAPPVQQAIAAVIATDVQCTGCVGTADIGGNAITAAKIKDSEVKTADIAGGAVNSAKIADGTVSYGDVSRSLIAAEHRDDCNCGGTGWDPDGKTGAENIYDPRIKGTSTVVVTLANAINITNVCWAQAANGIAQVRCEDFILDGLGINYAIFNNPTYG